MSVHTLPTGDKAVQVDPLTEIGETLELLYDDLGYQGLYIMADIYEARAKALREIADRKAAFDLAGLAAQVGSA